MVTWKSKANVKFSSYKFQSSKRIKREKWWEIPHVVIEPLSSTNDILYCGRQFEEKFLQLQLSENKNFLKNWCPHKITILNLSVTVYVCVCARVCMHMALSHVQLLQLPWTTVHQAPLSVALSRQEYWSGLPFPSPRDLPDPGIRPTSLSPPALTGEFFMTLPPG